MNGMNWMGIGATPTQIGSGLDYLMRLTDPVLQMQSIAQYLGWLNEAMRLDRELAARQERERNEQLKALKQYEEQMERNRLIAEADARRYQAERTATLMQSIGNLASFFSEFLKQHPNLFKRKNNNLNPKPKIDLTPKFSVPKKR